MSNSGGIKEAGVAGSSGSQERRASRRYPLRLELRYMAACNEVLRMGRGFSLNMSSKGILFVPDAELIPGARLEVTADWPAGHNGTALRLFLYGCVLSYDGRGAVATIERYSLIPDTAGEAGGSGPNWERMLAKCRYRLLRLGRSVQRNNTPPGRKR